MKKSIIVAMSANHGLGKDNKMMWHIPEDLKRFKSYTLNHHIIMGRKTFESIGNKALPNRTNIVVSRNSDYSVPNGVFLVKTIEEGLNIAKINNENEVFIIGGGEIYDQTINYVDTIYLTKLMDTFSDADAFFPAINFSDWIVRDNEIERIIFKGFDDTKKYDYEFMILDKK